MKCLKCEKDLKMLEGAANEPAGAGEMQLSFYYGSRHDQCHDFVGSRDRLFCVTPDSSRHERLLSCDRIRAYLCDDCFETHADLLEGWCLPSAVPGRKLL